jgi:cyclase
MPRKAVARSPCAIINLVALALLGTALQPAEAAQPLPGPAPTELPRLVKVRDDVFVIQNVNGNLAELQAFGGNLTVYLTDAGAILIDAKNEQMHEDVVAKVRSLTDKPIKYVVLTHNHGDHSGGTAKMQALGATVVISSADQDNMARAGRRDIPEIAFSGQARISLAGKHVVLRELRGHTRGDTIAFFPAARIVVAGDLVTAPGSVPGIVNYGDGGTWTDWGIALDEIARMDFDHLVPGHGQILTKQEFLAIRDTNAAIRERFRALNRERKSVEEIGKVLQAEFGWGTGPAAGNLAGMSQELR